MPNRFALVLALCLFPVGAARADGLTVVGASGGETTAGYKGPGDVVPGAVAWWGFRGYNKAYSGNAVTVCTALDASCETETISNGALVLGTVGTACLSSGTCLVKELFDQSGAKACNGAACDVKQTTTSFQTAFTAAALNSVPCTTFTPDQFLSGTDSLTLPQPFSFAVVSNRTGSTSSAQWVIGMVAATTPVIGYAAAANTATVSSGTAITATASDNAFHSLVAVQNGASPASSLTVDGTTTTGSSGTATFDINPILGEWGGGAGNFAGIFCEGGIWPIALSGPQISGLAFNQQTFWGF